MNVFKFEYSNEFDSTKIEFSNSVGGLTTVDELIDVFCNFLLACGFVQGSIEDSICELARSYPPLVPNTE